MTIIALDGFDTFKKANGIHTIIGEYEEIEMSGHTVHLEYFWVVLFNLLNRLIGIDLFTVKSTILVGCDQHMLIPYYRSVVDFAGIVEFKQELVRKRFKDINVLIKWCGYHQMLFGYINSVGNGETMVVVIGAVNLECCSRFGKWLFITWCQLDFLYYMEISCRISHVQGEVIDFSILKIKWSWIHRVLWLFIYEFWYSLITTVPRVQKKSPTLILSKFIYFYFQIRMVLSVLPVNIVSVFFE